MSGLNTLREESATAYTYGPSVRDFIDQHGHTIRTAGSISDILEKAISCSCCDKFSQFADTGVGHVRTQDPAILPTPLRELVAKGLNFRPRLKSTHREALSSAVEWARQVLVKLLHHNGSQRSLHNRLLHAFYSRLRNHTSPRKWEGLASGYDAELLKTQGLDASRHLACTSTDKAANTATFECIHWYRAICMQRLLSPAFADCTDLQSTASLTASAERWAPWADLSATKAAILFCTAKMHKRHADKLAYRFITNACSALSKPVSLEVTRVLTLLCGHVRKHCIALGNSMGAKLWWMIDSLDTVPLNLDCSNRNERRIAAFDVDKCYECVPLFKGEHSLLSQLKQFLELAFGSNEFMGSNIDWRGTPQADSQWVSTRSSSDVTYSREDVLHMVRDLLYMTVVTVGEESRKQDTGLPMGFSSSGILLNIYLFVYEYRFVLRLGRLRPDLLHVTHELFRYIDDLGCFCDYDIRQFLDELQTQSEDNPYWIYPLAPRGPLGIKDQTTRSSESTEMVYLDIKYTLSEGALSMRLHCKGKELPFKLLRFTHWSSSISRACKIGMIYAQTRTACRSARHSDDRSHNLEMMKSIFLSIGYPVSVVNTSMSKAVSVYSMRFPELST